MAKKKIYKFTGKEGAFMPEATLKKWIQNHEDHHIVKGHFYGKDVITKILNQEGCKGIRIYHGIDDQGGKKLILVGANEKGKDIWGASSTAKGKLGGGEGGGADQAMKCPPWCD